MRQVKVPYVGAFINVLYLTMPLLGILSYAISTLTFYTVNLVWISEHIGWMSLPVFLGMLVVVC